MNENNQPQSQQTTESTKTRVKSTSVKQQLQNDVDVYGIAYERQHPNGLTERIDPTTIRVIKPVPASESSHSPQTKREPWGFCETPEEKCTMNYCDDNGCINRKRNLVSHSPTEQPGDAKHTPLPQGKYYYGEADQNGVKPVFGAHDQLLWFSAPGSTTRFSDEKEAGRAAKIPALLSEVATLRSKQAELVAEIKELERHKKELALCLEQANQLIRRYEGIEREQSAELEQLRSERDKMREALEVSKKALYQIVDDARLKGVKYTAKAFGLVNGAYVKVESALSGGSKQ